MTINEQLLSAANEWTDKVFNHFIKEHTNNGKYVGKIKSRKEEYISCPFYTGVTDGWAIGKKTKVMIIGQEARGYERWTHDKANDQNMPEESQLWALYYLKKQIGEPISNKFDNISYNKSRFWALFRKLNEKGFAVCWNNLDKVYFDKEGNYKGTLPCEAEKILSAPFDNECGGRKSLLQREIEIANPDVLLFITGPDYARSMETAFGAEGKLKKQLNKEKKIIEITNIIQTAMPAFWTYHPSNRVGVNSTECFIGELSKTR